MGFEEVIRQDFQPYEGVLAKGFSKNPIWVRLSINPLAFAQSGTSNVPGRFILRLRPTYLDNVELFDPALPVTRPRITGDRWPSSADEFRSINLNFEISPDPGPRDIYLKISTTSTRLLSAQLLSFEDLYYEDSWLVGAYSIALGVSLLFLIWALAAWLLTRDRVIGVFAASQGAGVLLAFFILGFARHLFPNVFSPERVDAGMSVAVMLIVFLSVLFYVELWRDYRPPRKILWLLKGVLFVFPVQLALFFLDYRELALQLNWLMVLWVPLPNLLLAFTAEIWKVPPKQRAPVVPRAGLLSYCVAHLGIMVIGALSALGIMGNSELPIYLVLVHTLLSGALAVLLLQFRLKISKEYQDKLQLQLSLSEQQVAQEQKYRYERDSLFAMLAHELKTAMSTISLLLGSKSADDSFRKQVRESLVDMNEVIDKTLEMARFDDAQIQLRRESFDAIAQLQDLIEKYFPQGGAVLQGPPQCRLHSDQEIFKTVIGNIFSNAAKYRLPESAVEIKAMASLSGPKGLHVEVLNEPGPVGFPEPGKVFEKYYRSPLSKSLTGSGLGLYLVQGLCEILGGQVSYERVGDRVCFRVWIPA